MKYNLPLLRELRSKLFFFSKNMPSLYGEAGFPALTSDLCASISKEFGNVGDCALACFNWPRHYRNPWLDDPRPKPLPKLWQVKLAKLALMAYDSYHRAPADVYFACYEHVFPMLRLIETFHDRESAHSWFRYRSRIKRIIY